MTDERNMVRRLIDELEGRGVQLWAEDGALRFRAPKGVLTPEWMATLKENKAALLRHLDRTAGGLVADPDGRHDPFPLTDVQSAYLLGRHEAFAYGGVGCHGYFEVAFPDLDPERLTAAWRRLVERHDMLRAVIDADGHQQVLADVPAYEVAVTDLREQDADAVAATRDELREDLSHRVYDPAQWPMFDLRVTRAADHDLLHFSIDLLIADYASIQLLIAELDQLYRDPDAPLPALEIGFRDVVLTERASRGNAGAEADRQWWLARVDELPPRPDLPLLDRPASGPVRFRRWSTALDAARWDQLRRFAAERKLTPTGALLAAYADVLRTWSRQPRFTLNLTLLDRPSVHPQVSQLVGDFTSVTLLAVEHEPTTQAAARFADRAGLLQERLWENLDHRQFSGVEVLRETARRRGAQAALMPVVFTSTVGLADDTAQDGSFTRSGDLRHGISQTPQVWIDCQVMEHRGELLVSWDVREDVFPDGLVDAMFGAYAGLLDCLSRDAACWDQRHPVGLPVDQARRRAEVNDTTVDLPVGLLQDPVLAQAARTPDRVAVVAPDRTLTYAELLGHADAVARWLREVGCRPGEPVAVLMEKGWEQVAGALGVLLAGGAYVPVDVNQPALRRDAMIEAAGARLLLTQSRFEAPGEAVLAVDGLTARPVRTPTFSAPTRPDDLAYVIFTSGSTGVPKGVMISHRAAANTIADINARFAVGAQDRVLGLANLGFDLSVYDIFGLLAVGGAVVLPDPDRRGDPAHWAELVATHDVTVWNSVPAQMHMLHEYLAGTADAATRPLGLRLALLSGDWIPVTLPDAVRALVPGLRVISLGGATEAGIWSVFHPVDTVDPAWPSIPYGRPLANQTLHVLDTGLRPRPEWVAGELFIGGVGLAMGYLGDPERTAQRFVTDPGTGRRLYRTGDLGRYHPDGTIEFLGREDSQVKIRGHRIELAEIDAALSSHPAVGNAACVVVGDRPLEKRLVAFAEPRRRPVPVELTEVTRRVEAAAVRGAEVVADGVEGDAVRQVVGALDGAALGAMREALRAAGLFTDPATVHDLDEVLTAARVAPRHHRLVRRWLRALTEQGYLEATAGGWRLGSVAPAAPGAEPGWDEIEALATKHGHGAELIGYLRASAERLPELLREELDPLALLFPEGSIHVAQAAYRDNLISRYLNSTLASSLRAIAEAHPAGRPLAVLEVGAGVGGTTDDLLAALDGHDVDYLFTDVSPFFLSEARTRFADRPQVRYGLFDLNGDPQEQGLDTYAFDVVVCANVLHNAVHAGEVLRRVTRLVRPGGWLLFIEATGDNYPLMASMEFKEGLTDFADERATDHRTFHTRQSWLTYLAGAGGELAFCLPAEEHALSAVGQHAFGARIEPGRAPLDVDELTAHLADRLPPAMLPSRVHLLDALPLTGNGKVDRAALVTRAARSGPNRGTEAGDEPRTDLERRTAAVWAELLELPTVGRDVDFYSVGGDSLLVSKLVGVLRERLPEAGRHSWDTLLRQMLRTPTVAGLAAWLAEGSTPTADGGLTGQQSALVTLAAGTDPQAPARVLVHDGSGTLSPYRSLVPLLADGGPVYGLTVADTAGYLATDADMLIAQLAADYRVALAGTGATRFEVVGYCLGGLVATELARQLTEAGAEVTRLVVISSYRVPYVVEDDLVAEYAFARLIDLDPAVLGYPADEAALDRALDAVLTATPGRLPAGAFATLDGDPELREVAAAFAALGSRSPAERLAAIADAAPGRFGTDRSVDAVADALRLFRHSLAAVTSHPDDPYAGDVTFLRQLGKVHFLPSLRADMTAYWRDVCLGDLRVVDVPGDHFTCLQSPHVTQVAAAVNDGTDPC